MLLVRVLSVFDAAVVAFPYRPVFEELAKSDPARYAIFEPKDWEEMETNLNALAPLKVMVEMVRSLPPLPCSC